MIFLCRLIDSSYSISQSLAFVKHFFNFFVSFQEIISLFVKFLKLFLSCHCCVAVVCCNVKYHITFQETCQAFFIFFNYFYVLSFFHVFFVFLLIFILPTKKEPDHSDSFSHTFYFTVSSKLHTNFSSKPITFLP